MSSPNTVILKKHPNNQFTLWINGFCAKENFTSTTIEGVMDEIDTFLADSSDEGGERFFSGTVTDLTDLTQTYVNSGRPLAAEFIADHSLISFIDLSVGQ